VAHDNSGTPLGRWFRLSQIFGEGSIHVPVCGRCWWKFWVQRVFREWGYIVFAVVGLLTLLHHLENRGWSEELRAYILLGLGVAFALVYFVVDRRYARHFESSIHRDEVEYVFARRRFAMDFARLNGTHASAR
jgi:hypothetical protein